MTCQRLNLQDRTSDTMMRLIKSLILPKQPTLTSNTAWPSDLDLAVSELSMRRYSNAVVTSQIKARSRSLGLDPEPMRVGPGISCIDYCCLAKKSTSVTGSPESFSSDDSGQGQHSYFLLTPGQNAVDELHTLPHATRRARQGSLRELSALRKLSIDNNYSGRSTSTPSPQISFEPSPQSPALSSNLPLRARLQRSQSINERLECNSARPLGLVIAPATLLECFFEERLEEGVEELTKKLNDYQTATASATPSLIHSSRSHIHQGGGCMAPQDDLAAWIDPMLAMFGRAYGVWDYYLLYLLPSWRRSVPEESLVFVTTITTPF